MRRDPGLDQVRAEYPSWNVFASADGSDLGWLYASRVTGRLTDAQMRAGCVMTVCAADLAGLRNLIADQAAAEMAAG